MSIFDPATFLDATVSEPFTSRPPLPEGDYVSIIKDVASRAWTGKKDPSKSGIALDVTLVLEIPLSLQETLGLTVPSITMTDSVLLDLTLNGAIDLAPGKNRKLRMYREAVDLNKAGDAFSPRALAGKAIKVKVKHEIYEEKIQERVAAVAALV